VRLWLANLGDRFDQVIGVSDPRHGGEICAWIKLKGGQSATPGEIREFCKRHIARCKVPRDIELVPEFSTSPARSRSF
jgi:fatty-acyl-CoA synthase